MANAECAWVLWKSSTTNYDEKSKRWEIITAVPVYEKCIEGKNYLVKNDLESYKKLYEGADVTSSSPDHILVVKKKGESIAFESLDYFCLPDTIDPRK
jgi:hypothetical protein